MLGVFVNLGLNALLIPRWAAAGAAVATLCAESFVALYQIWVCRGAIPVGRYTFRNWFFLAAGAVMFLPVYWYGETHGASVRTLLVQLAIGVAVYAAVAGAYVLAKEKALVKAALKR